MKHTLGVLAALVLTLPLVATQATAGGNSGVISITGDSGFQACGCVSSGNGTVKTPYVIGPLTIDSDNAPAVSIKGTTADFDLDHITIHTTGKADGIVLTNVIGPASITKVNIDTPGTKAFTGVGGGIALIDSTGVTINGDSINTVGNWGIRVVGGSHNEIKFMTVAHAGLTNPASNSTGSLSPQENPFITGITGDAPGGVLLKNTLSNFVHDNLLNEDAYAGVELVGGGNNTLQKIVVRYPDYFGAVLQSSTGNTLDDLSLQTADFDGLLVRASDNNIITNSTFSANGPIGNEWNANVVPYFIAGAYVGWGSIGNSFRSNNGNFGNTGPDLVFDDGNLLTAAGFTIHGVLQTAQPLNQLSTYPPLLLAAGVSSVAVVAGANTACGNSFAPGYWYPSNLNANTPCP